MLNPKEKIRTEIIQLPYKFYPRDYQIPIVNAFNKGYKRIIQLWHRRSGKDKLDVNIVAREMNKKVGAYYYFYPTYAQGRKALWEAIGKDGFKYTDHFPKELVEKTNDTNMQVFYKNGSIFQIIGTDDIDKIVGTNPIGLVFSEYSLQNPKAWEFMRPILRENGGWAIFNFTPRGKNHAYDLYNMAMNNDSWFVSKLTVDDTDTLTPSDIQEERDAGMLEEMIQQEYYCSFTAAIIGAYYSKEVELAEREGRFTNVPYDPHALVHTVWDLGIADAMAIGFYQIVGQEVHMIDYYEGSNQEFAKYVKIVKDKPYVFGNHFAPHDIKQRELMSGKTRLDTARELGIQFQVVPSISVESGIDHARRMFRKVWADKEKCKDWIRLIPQYTKDYDEKKKMFKDTPLHDWTSHGADQFRYASLVVDKMINETPQAIAQYQYDEERENSDFDPFDPV